VKVAPTEIPEVLLIESKVFPDERGRVLESYNRRALAQAAGIDFEFVQDNDSFSKRNVLRGLHYQVGSPQGKLVRVMRGDIFDVAVDLRRSSPTFKRWVGLSLSAAAERAVWIPPGFAHGFLALSDAQVSYKLTGYYSPAHERTLAWDDPDIAVRWPTKETPVISAKDRVGKKLPEAELFA
jgi:dTDP-4-dehydrorhamnose 3,5-epimerase